MDPEVVAKLTSACLRMGIYELRFEPDFDEKFEAIARKELRETPENVEKGIVELRTLVEGEPGLKIPLEEFHLKMFLRSSKFYPSSAFALIKRYYKFKLKHPDFFTNLLPSRDRAAFLQNIMTILPLRTNAGERVLIIEAGRKWVPKECSLVDVVRATVLMMEGALIEPRTQVAGAQIILDMEGLSMGHLWQFTPSIAKDIVDFVQECMPLKVINIHIVNQPYVFNMVYSIFKPFLAEKLRKRLRFHGTDYKDLHKFIEAKILPGKYDGAADIPMDCGEGLSNYLCNFEPEYKEKNYEGYVSQIKS